MLKPALLTLTLLTLPTLHASQEHTVRQPLPPQQKIDTLPPDGGPHFNRLIHETSPYLRQHARNPIDWHPWGDEAFQKARTENKPIFLSVGYSSCHWCHVMEHESFEHPDVAKILNDLYISIKVDREERPDIDQIYMNATQTMTGRGGWPNSLWLDADARPWYCGTYFPREDRNNQPGFKTILTRLHQVWINQQDQIQAQAQQIETALQRMTYTQPQTANDKPTLHTLDQLLDDITKNYDSKNGGFGNAPKFPPHGILELLLQDHQTSTNKTRLAIAEHTLQAMWLGGIHDHIGGGFHRYSTDANWFLPHFEKMLYDNAQLLRTYALAYDITQKPLYKQAVQDIAQWLEREMTDPAGGLYSALDADSEGQEAIYYLWSQKELIQLLGKNKAHPFAKRYQCTPSGNYYDEATHKTNGSSIPHLKYPIDPTSDEATQHNINRNTLLKTRLKRIPPALDDKILTSWNGLAISGLAIAGRLTQDIILVERAERIATFLLRNMQKNQRLLRTYRAGQAKLNAYLDDYIFLAEGLLNLHAATSDPQWVNAATQLMATVQTHFADPQGGYYFTSNDHQKLLTRGKDPFESAVPSGNGTAVRVLLKLHKLTGKQHYYDQAQKSIDFHAGYILQAPRASTSFILAMIDLLKQQQPPQQQTTITRGPITLETLGAPSDNLRLRFTIKENWHINSHTPGINYLIPTTIQLHDSPHWTLAPIQYPPGKPFAIQGSDTPFTVYEKKLELPLTLTTTQKNPAPPNLKITFQACDTTRCLTPQTITLQLK